VLDWREIWLGAVIGLAALLLIGVVLAGGLLGITLSDLSMAVIAYLPAGFWAAYRARTGHPAANALVAGGILFLLLSLLASVLNGLVLPIVESWLTEVIIVACTVIVSAMMAQMLQE